MKVTELLIVELLIAALIVSVVLGYAILEFAPEPSSSYLYVGQAVGPENSGSTLILDVPFAPQEDEFYCSEASASMVLEYYGENFTQDEIHSESDRFETMAPFLSKHVGCELVHDFGEADLRNEISQGDPVMVRILAGKYRHTIVVVGYDKDHLYVHDSAYTYGAFLKVDPAVLSTYWAPTDFAAIIFTD